MEPTYFDKTSDYPTGCEDNRYLLTAQNCSATRDDKGDVVLVTEDIGTATAGLSSQNSGLQTV